MSKKGILLISAGHPYYGKYAYQLAVSIKHQSPDVSISVITEGNGLNHLYPEQKKIFDQIIEADPKHYTSKTLGIRDVFKIKTSLYDLTPYDTTLYLDADMLWLPKKNVEQLFDELKDIDFTMSNRGSMMIAFAPDDFIEWTKPSHLVDAYGFKDEMLYHLSSEFIYFKKTKDVKSLFDKTKKAFDYPKVNYKLFGNNQPDELSFTIAMMQSKVYPHTSPFYPAYWENAQRKNMQAHEMYKEYYLCSFGGATSQQSVKTIYNNLAKYYLNNIGEQAFPLQDKNKFLPDRAVI